VGVGVGLGVGVGVGVGVAPLNPRFRGVIRFMFAVRIFIFSNTEAKEGLFLSLPCLIVIFSNEGLEALIFISYILINNIFN
jgi:hypothetical protein